MYNYNTDTTIKNNVVGNEMYSDDSFGYREEIKGILEAYTNAGVNFTNDMLKIISDPETKHEFLSLATESIQTSPIYTNPIASSRPFYNNYGARMETLMDNSMKEIARESAMLGYAPIVSYNPFFLKKFWVENIFKDILMTEIPKSPVINIAVEQQFAVDLNKNEYPLPDALYDEEIAKKLLDASTGINIKEDPIAISNFKPALNILTSTYFPELIDGDKTAELTADLHIFQVIVTDSESKEHIVPCNIRADVTNHTLIGGNINYDVRNEDGTLKETIHDQVVGNVDFKNGKVTIFSSEDKVTKVCLRGKLANRFNQRSIDIKREVKPLQYTMPESGPRLNSSITIEEAADALALQNIDLIAYNADLMGQVLANLEDMDIKIFLKNSFDAQELANNNIMGYDKLTVRNGFNALPYDGYTGRITEWMKDSREYFERLIAQLKTKLRTSDIVIVAVCNPNLVRFLQDGISWVFTDDTQISGVKLSYNFGVYTSAQDRVHIVTSQKLSEDDGIRFVVIPLTSNLITFKHYVYNMVIDRNYRNPLYQLTPNIMATMRSLTFEVLPVQGLMDIQGRDLNSPETLKRAIVNATPGTGTTTPGGTGGETGTP